MMHFLPSGICEQIAIHDWFELSTVEVTKVTYRCTFRDSTRTLESSVIDGIINDLRTHIKDKLGFELG
jgi:phenylalanyl-tRNA synthetase beta subunit